VAYLKNRDASEDHLGLRLVEGVADRMEYRRTIGLNNVRMVIRKPDGAGEGQA
jgi:hypothetical protein